MPRSVNRFEFHDLPPSFNTMLRTHWSTRKKVKEYYTLLFRNALNVSGFDIIEPCEIVVTWCVMQLMDSDNAKARFKLIGDAMKAAGVISDDSPDIVRSLIVMQNRAAHQNEQGFSVEVREYLPFGEIDNAVSTIQST